MNRSLTTVSLILCLTGNSLAQGTGVLTMEDCRRLALEHNLDIAARQAATEASKYVRRSVKARFLPEFTFSATGFYSSADGQLKVQGGHLPLFQLDAGTGQLLPMDGFAYFPGLTLDYRVGTMAMAGLGVEQPVYMGGRIKAAYRLAKIGEEVALWEERQTTADVVERTDKAYIQLVKAGEMMRVAIRFHTLLDELYRRVERAYNRGMKPKNEVLKVRVRLDESSLALRRAENARRLAAMNLCHYIGYPLRTEVQVADSLPPFRPAGFPDSLFSIEARPEYVLLDRQEEAARQQVQLVRGERLPQVGIRGGYNYLYGLEVDDEPIFNKGSFSVMMHVSFPLYHFGEKANRVKAAQARLHSLVLTRESKNGLLQMELVQALNEWEETRMEQDMAVQALRQAEENLRVSTRQYDVGLEPLSDNLEAHLLWQQAQSAVVESRYNHYLAWVHLQKVTGQLGY